MNIDGWDIEDALLADPPSVNETQRLFECRTGRFAAVLYHIFEYRMGVELARLAVFENKTSPKLILKQPEILWLATPLDSGVTWISESTLAVVTAVKREMPIVLIDLDVERFCFMHVLRGDTYRMELCEGVLSLFDANNDDVSASVWRRPFDALHWLGFDRFPTFFGAYDESAALHGIPSAPVRQRVLTAIEICMNFVLFILLSVPFRAIDWARRLVTSRNSRG